MKSASRATHTGLLIVILFRKVDYFLCLRFVLEPQKSLLPFFENLLTRQISTEFDHVSTLLFKLSIDTYPFVVFILT